jgi:hypothetical protein
MTVAKACTPIVPEKMSITNPVIKERKRSIHEGIAIGRIRMNITYTYGFT